MLPHFRVCLLLSEQLFSVVSLCACSKMTIALRCATRQKSKVAHLLVAGKWGRWSSISSLPFKGTPQWSKFFLLGRAFSKFCQLPYNTDQATRDTNLVPDFPNACLIAVVPITISLVTTPYQHIIL